jgi:hypothetical protein
VGSNRGGVAAVGAVVMLVLLRVALRLSRHGSQVGRLAVIVDVAVLAVLVVYAVTQNRRSR